MLALGYLLNDVVDSTMLSAFFYKIVWEILIRFF